MVPSIIDLIPNVSSTRTPVIVGDAVVGLLVGANVGLNVGAIVGPFDGNKLGALDG